MKTILNVLLVVVALTLVFSTFAFAEAGGDVFKAKCAMCHGPDGSGNTVMGKNLKLKDLGSADVQKQSDEELATVIGKGKNKMPAFDGKLSKDQINDVVKYIRTLKK